MPFPKSPSKPAFGKLKLVIKPPGVTVEAEASPEIPLGPQDSIIRFKPPAGFSVDESLCDLITRQESAAFKALDEIERRYLKCAPCRKRGYNAVSLEQARRAVVRAAVFLRGQISQPMKLLISHDKSGDVYLELSYSGGVARPKTVFMLFVGSESDKPSRIAHHQHYMSLQDMEEIPYSQEQLDKSLVWLLDTKG